MSDSSHAIFLSYARDDAAAARRVAEALRASGLEVWFDENELRGGDAWDVKIRRQIDECTLFVPLISEHTEARAKGYFRLEWKLAVEQTHLLAEGVPFIAPVVIDGTHESGAVVPAEFMKVQWTRLPGALPTPEFVEQVKRLLEAPKKPVEVGRGRRTPPSSGNEAGSGDPALQKKKMPGWAWGALAAVAVVVAVGVVLLRKPGSPAAPTGQTSTPSLSPSFSPPPAAADKSIAVLPFANLSTEKENEFFADGVHDDVITNLAKIRDLKVISRTSVLAYRDTAARNLKKIAAELGVVTILEGSVRRIGSKVHMNAQLIDARTDEHLWADTFDGDTSDIFALQASLAQKIAAALKATLTPGEKSLIERRPTGNQEAYDLFLRARAMQEEVGESGTMADYVRIITVYEQVVARDPSFALAQAQVSLVHSIMYWFGFLDPTPTRAEKMKTAVDAAVHFAPDAPETHLAMGAYHYRVERDWAKALAEFRAAAAGLPNDAQLLFWLAITHRRLGRWSEAANYFEQAAALNPRNLAIVTNLVDYLANLRRWEQTRAAAIRFFTYFPQNRRLLDSLATAEFALDGDGNAFARAIETLPPQPGDPTNADGRYSAAWFRGDLAAADRVLADPQLANLPESVNTVINDPPALFRAELAFIRGDQVSARRFSDEAIAYYRRGRWNARQQPWVRMRMAQAYAWAGRADESLRDAREAMAEVTIHDVYDAVHLRQWQGEVLLSLGRNDEAVGVLRELMTGPSFLTPNEARSDPLWSRLKNDPRFEEILRSAKSL